MSLPDPSITDIHAVGHRPQFLEDCSWNPLGRMSVVSDHYRGTNQQVAEFGMLIMVPLLVGLLCINNALGVGLEQVEPGSQLLMQEQFAWGHTGGGMRRGPVINRKSASRWETVRLSFSPAVIARLKVCTNLSASPLEEG